MSLHRSVLNTTGMLLLAAAVYYSLTYWPQRVPMLPGAGDSAKAKPGEPDYTITAFHAIDLDESGRLRYELAAERLVHFPDPERASLVAPDMVFYRNQAAVGEAPPEPWQLTANTGEITERGDRLDLNGDVKVARLVDESVDRMTMEAQQLTVYGKQEMASTNGPVVLRSSQAELTGVGMRIDMKKGQMHLLSQVRGHYDPR